MTNTPPRNPTSGAARILEIRGRRGRLNEQVRRNPGRFPPDFAFQLSPADWENLMSQFATSSWGGRRKLPFAFTEHGALMAASVLNSVRAVEVSIHVVRTFVAMREAIASTSELARRLEDLEKKLERDLEKHDEAIAEILRAIRGLMTPPEVKRRPIGFLNPPDSGRD